LTKSLAQTRINLAC